MSNSQPPRLADLIGLFFDDPTELGAFENVDPNQMPDDYRRLLAHDAHMTVTLERFHESQVDLKVLDHRVESGLYARKILLQRSNDGVVVQFGIVRIDLGRLSEAVRAMVVAQETPLGRILIDNGVMRQVRLAQLFRIEPGDELLRVFQFESQSTGSKSDVYGRTAVIDCDNAPAIELLEIVVA